LPRRRANAILSELVGEIDSNRRQRKLSSAIHLFVLDYLRTRAASAASDSKLPGWPRFDESEKR